MLAPVPALNRRPEDLDRPLGEEQRVPAGGPCTDIERSERSSERWSVFQGTTALPRNFKLAQISSYKTQNVDLGFQGGESAPPIAAKKNAYMLWCARQYRYTPPSGPDGGKASSAVVSEPAPGSTSVPSAAPETAPPSPSPAAPAASFPASEGGRSWPAVLPSRSIRIPNPTKSTSRPTQKRNDLCVK